MATVHLVPLVTSVIANHILYLKLLCIMFGLFILRPAYMIFYGTLFALFNLILVEYVNSNLLIVKSAKFTLQSLKNRL